MSQRLTDDDGPFVWSMAPMEQHMTGPDGDAVTGDKPDDDKPTDDDDDTDDDASGDGDPDDTDDEDDDVKKASATAKERMRAADKRAAALQKERDDLLAEKKKLDDAKLDELGRAQNRVKELEAVTAEQEAEIKKLRIHNAFFSTNKIQWIDPAEALDALDVSDVDIDDSGKVNRKKLGAAIEALAKQKSHWVKSENDGDGSSGASGSQMNGQRKGGDKNGPTKEQLAKNFPALQNRLI